MAVTRRANVPAAAVAALAGVNFFDDSFYSGVAFIPDGDYATYYNVVMYQGKDTAKKARLGVQIDFYPLTNPTEEAKLQSFYSMGSKADESFAPNPETGKGIVPIPGAKGQNMNDSTNWNVYRKSLLNSGLPPGVVTSDLSVIDGTWVHIMNEDEPAERGNFQSATAEVQQERRKNKIAVVTEILEGGKPWEGTGGLPAAPVGAAAPRAAAPLAPRAPAPVAPRAPAPTLAPRPVAPRVPAPVLPVAAAAVETDVMDLASQCLTTVLMKKPMGMPWLALNNDAFALATKQFGGDVASQIAEHVLQDGENMMNVLGALGFTIVGTDVKPTAA